MKLLLCMFHDIMSEENGGSSERDRKRRESEQREPRARRTTTRNCDVAPNSDADNGRSGGREVAGRKSKGAAGNCTKQPPHPPMDLIRLRQWSQ